MASLIFTTTSTTAGDYIRSFADLRRQTRLLSGCAASNAQLGRRLPGVVRASRSSPRLNGRKLRVAVVGGGPAGGAAAEALAKGGVETILIERKLDNCKPCGGAIPLCMVDEFGLPLDLIDRRVTKYISMVRREVLDAYLRGRAADAGASVINGLFLRLDQPEGPGGSYKIHYNEYSAGGRGVGERRTEEVDAVVGADGANSRVAKSIGAGEYDYLIAFQERVQIPEVKMEYCKERAEMYVGDDVSPDFYGWVFPKCDHVAVGTGTLTHKTDIKKFQAATRLRAKNKIEGGTIIRFEAHPIPDHPRPRRVLGRVALVGDAAGYVTRCSGEGIYFAAKSGRMCAEAIVKGSENGTRMIDESDLRKYLEKFDRMYWPTFKALDVLKNVFYRSNATREALVEMCADEYVQKMTFDSYLYKRVVPGNPLDDLKLAVNTVASLSESKCLEQ
ncbi:geranylgeranyl diphosphate reductase, chloroplastic [Canna indica]|uniref:Geranylgeranyl diphosphate reductase, chloroplastic n=1 Tax=Canna indica TaxID=4628 RepID=A0AAQ3L0X0_9LILI|nr:geranylgeranyl diphosphate reductase, chloroplastic [Canna indica]